MRRLEPRLIPLDALLLSLILHFYCFVAFFSFLDFPFDTLVWGEKSGYKVGKKKSPWPRLGNHCLVVPLFNDGAASRSRFL